MERVIGRGGMGTVFEARHTRLNQRVAIKVLGDELRMHPELVKRFEREARAAGALSSPHAVRIFDIDSTDDGTPFIVMELLEGRDLAQLVESNGPQLVGLAVRWVIEASDAISEAHRLGIIHRDIKPSNLLLCDSGSIKVLDFGIAKRVATSRSAGEKKEAAITLGVAPLGTPQYMSPEQVRCAKDVDARTDIWSLGVTLYELLTGRPPFNHDIPQACVAAIVADPIPDPRSLRADLPDELAEVLLRALAKDPNERFQSVDAFVLALTPFADPTLSLNELGSWRTVSGARRAAAVAQENNTTLDGDDLIIELATPSERSILHPLQRLQNAARAKIHRHHNAHDDEEHTVPPTVSRASVASSHSKRVRSSLALAAAVGLGLVALVVTPKCVGSHLDAAAHQGVLPPSQSQVGEAVVKAAHLLPGDETGDNKANDEAAATPTMRQQRQQQQDAIPVDTAPRSAKPQAKPSAAQPAVVRPLSSGPVRFIGSEHPVHGGISNPGF